MECIRVFGWERSSEGVSLWLAGIDLTNDKGRAASSLLVGLFGIGPLVVSLSLSQILTKQSSPLVQEESDGSRARNEQGGFSELTTKRPKRKLYPKKNQLFTHSHSTCILALKARFYTSCQVFNQNV